MKNTSIVLGIITAFFLLSGTLLKIEHWPGAGIALTLALGPLNLFFQLFLLIHNLMQRTNGLTKTTQIFGAIAGVIYPMGVLFKIQHWPGSGLLSLAGMFFLFFVFTPLLIACLFQKDSPLRQITAPTVLAVSIFAILFTVAINATGPSRNILENMLTIADNEERALSNSNATTEQLYAEVELRKLNASDSSVQSLYQKAMALNKSCMEMNRYIEGIKRELLQEVEGSDTITNVKYCLHKDNYDIPSHYMIGDDPNNATGKAAELKNKITSLKKIFYEFIRPDDRHLLRDQLWVNSTYSITEEREIFWEEQNFYHCPIVGVIATLTQIQLRVKLSEAQLLTILLFENKTEKKENIK